MEEVTASSSAEDDASLACYVSAVQRLLTVNAQLAASVSILLHLSYIHSSFSCDYPFIGDEVRCAFE